MSDVVDFLRYKAGRRQQEPSALSSCLLHETLVDITAVLDALEHAASGAELNLSAAEREQLDYLALTAEAILDRYEELGFNEVEVKE